MRRERKRVNKNDFNLTFVNIILVCQRKREKKREKEKERVARVTGGESGLTDSECDV